MGKLLDIVGKRFGSLVVLDETKHFGKRLKRKCKCDCGKEVWITTYKITSGNTKSCTCYRRGFRKLAAGQAVRNQLLDDYKRGALKRGLCWELSDEEFDMLIGGDCHYCGEKPSRTRKARRLNGDFTYNGIDRQDPNEGYVAENVVSCCYICNRAKSNMTLEEFEDWIFKLCRKRS